MRRHIIHTYKQAKRVVIIVVGFTVFIIGIIMLPLPGPGLPIILVALGILATEFIWAKRLLQKFKDTAEDVKKTPLWKKFFGAKPIG